MRILTVHVLVYGAVNALLVVLWLMLGGDWAGAADPLAAAREAGFWPFWVAAIWGVIVVLHAGLTIVVRGWARGRRRRQQVQNVRDTAATTGTHWVAAMFTDIVGSTALTRELGDAAYAEVLADHRRTVRQVLGDHDGTEVGTQGDGFLVTFAMPRQAVGCAVALQQRLADVRRDAGRTPHVRIGVHAGQVEARDGDVVGHMVNVAARVADMAGPDQIVVTEPVAEQAPGELELDDLGLRDLAGLPTPRHLLLVRWND